MGWKDAVHTNGGAVMGGEWSVSHTNAPCTTALAGAPDVRCCLLPSSP